MSDKSDPNITAETRSQWLQELGLAQTSNPFPVGLDDASETIQHLRALLRETLPYLPTELRGRVKGVVGK